MKKNHDDELMDPLTGSAEEYLNRDNGFTMICARWVELLSQKLPKESRPLFKVTTLNHINMTIYACEQMVESQMKLRVPDDIMRGLKND